MIVKSRIAFYRRAFHWLHQEDFDDIEFGLRPRLIELAKEFCLPEERLEAKVVSYFCLRIKGEADSLLKSVTGMKQMTDPSGKSYFFLNQESLNSLDRLPIENTDRLLLGDSCFIVDKDIIEDIEDTRQRNLLSKIIDSYPVDSTERIWLNCYIYKIQGLTWEEIAKKIEYSHTDYVFLKDNTCRFVNRLKDKLIHMGENINCKILGIYTDVSDIGMCILDYQSERFDIIWSKKYDQFSDLDKIEAKLGDIFRQFEISYVVLNQNIVDNRAYVIAMRYLTKRESYVEEIDLKIFKRLLQPHHLAIQGQSVDHWQRQAYIIARIKSAQLKWVSENAR